MKNNALKIINPILFILLIVAGVALAIYKLGGYSENMAKIHQIAGILFFITGFIHLIFNWGWIRTNILKKKKHKK
jgi:hypothetical protein